MPTTEMLTVRVSPQAQNTIQELSVKTALPADDIVERAVEKLRRKLLFEEAEAAYAALQRQPDLWHAIEQENAVWDVTLADGLEPEDWSEYELKPRG